MRCPEYLPSNNKGVIGYDREGAEAESGDQEGRKQGSRVETLRNSPIVVRDPYVEVDVSASHVITSCDCGNFHCSI